MVANGMTRRLVIGGCPAGGGRSEVTEAAMGSCEEMPHHKIHPANLATDIGASAVSTCPMWRGWLVAAEPTAFEPQDGRPDAGGRQRG